MNGVQLKLSPDWNMWRRRHKSLRVIEQTVAWALPLTLAEVHRVRVGRWTAKLLPEKREIERRGGFSSMEEALLWCEGELPRVREEVVLRYELAGLG